MTQEQKELLLKDLCARLYTCNCINGTALIVALADEQPLESNQWLISNYDCYKDKFIVSNIVYASDVERLVDIDNIRPYLFPLSSMTAEQKTEFNTRSLELQLKVIDDEIMYEKATEFEVDFYNKHHLDWRGLIPMGLALDATGKNIY